jgi:hypothetical protein
LTSQTDKQANVDINKVQEKRFTDSLLSTIAAICQMDPMLVSSKVTSSRIIMVSYEESLKIQLTDKFAFPSQFFIFLAFSLLYAAYTANIVSLLQSPSKSIRTLQELYDSKLTLGMEDTPYNRYFYTISTEPLETKVFRDKLAPPGQKAHFIR